MATGATFQNIFFPFNNPTQISGCQLWLDGADPAGTGILPANGATVSTWTDKSANGFNATVAPSRTAGTFSSAFNCVYFQSSTVGYQTSYSANPTNETMFIVANINSPANINNNTIIGGQLGARSFGVGYAGGGGGIGYSSYLNNEIAWQNSAVAGPSPGVTALLTGTVTSTTNVAVALNGSTFTTGTVPSWSSGTTTYLGVDTTTTAYYYVGYAMEIIFYNSVLNTTQRQQVEGYLAWKWGLQGNLPSNHPYKSAAPVGSGPTFNTSQITSIPLNIQKNRNFTPPQISNCQLWMDAADSTTITRSGANITQWNDKANNYSGPATNNPQYNSNPINGLPTIRFDGSSNRYVLISANNYNYSFMTYFMVIRWISGTGGFMGTDTPSNYGRALAVSSPNVQLLLYSQFYTTNIPLTANQPCILSAYFNGTTNFTVILNGTPTLFAVGQGTGNTNTNGFNIGVFNPSNSGNHSFDMGEGIVYSSILSDTQRQQVEGYLAWKWGLVASLPAGHPYLNNNISYNPFPITTPAFTRSISSIFKPTNYAGCQLWLDAWDPFGNGSRQKSPLTLTRWIDKSANARHATMFNGTNISYSPTAFNNRPALLFTQTQNMSSAAAAGTFPTSFTFFMIYHRTGGGTYDTLVTRTVAQIPAPLDILTYVSSGNFARLIGNGTAYADYNTTSGSNFTNVTTPSLYYANATAATGLLDAFNFATPTDPSSGTLTGVYYGDTATAIYIGTRANSGTTLTASVAEVIVYSTTPTAPQRQQIEGYLAWKWGLVASLPASHPYKNYPPPPQ